MAKIEQLPTVSVHARLILSEDEMAALDALAGYGIDGFLEVFYRQMGRSYLQPHERGLRDLFETARAQIPPILKRAKAARDAFGDTP